MTNGPSLIGIAAARSISLVLQWLTLLYWNASTFKFLYSPKFILLENVHHSTNSSKRRKHYFTMFEIRLLSLLIKRKLKEVASNIDLCCHTEMPLHYMRKKRALIKFQNFMGVKRRTKSETEILHQISTLSFLFRAFLFPFRIIHYSLIVFSQTSRHLFFFRWFLSEQFSLCLAILPKNGYQPHKVLTCSCEC